MARIILSLLSFLCASQTLAAPINRRPEPSEACRDADTQTRFSLDSAQGLLGRIDTVKDVADPRPVLMAQLALANVSNVFTADKNTLILNGLKVAQTALSVIPFNVNALNNNGRNLTQMVNSTLTEAIKAAQQGVDLGCTPEFVAASTVAGSPDATSTERNSPFTTTIRTGNRDETATALRTVFGSVAGPGETVFTPNTATGNPDETRTLASTVRPVNTATALRTIFGSAAGPGETVFTPNTATGNPGETVAALRTVFGSVAGPGETVFTSNTATGNPDGTRTIASTVRPVNTATVLRTVFGSVAGPGETVFTPNTATVNPDETRTIASTVGPVNTATILQTVYGSIAGPGETPFVETVI